MEWMPSCGGPSLLTCRSVKPRVKQTALADKLPKAPIDPANKRIVWLSLDETSGVLDVYPADVAERLEDGLAHGKSSVSLAGLGLTYIGVEVLFTGTRTRRMQQSTQFGSKKEVRRMEVHRCSTHVSAKVIHEGIWIFADDIVPNETKTLTIALSGYEMVQENCSSIDAFALHENAEMKITRAAAVGSNSGLVGLWEWCKKINVTNIGEVPSDMWGIYDKSQNQEIEQAFQSGKASARIIVGIRTFEILFDGPDSAYQIDHMLKKGRHVRRRLVTPQDLDVKLGACLNKGAFKEGEECSLCLTPFAETPLIHVCRLQCGHAFHRPCVQHVADKSGPCPLCRGEVAWSSV